LANEIFIFATQRLQLQQMNYFSSEFKLGILGGGQLGKMLLSETRKFDIQTFVLDPSDEAPARLACNNFFQGDLLDFDTVYRFGKLVDLLTIEIENVNLEALEKLEKEGLKVYPSPKTLRLIQSKVIQKEFYTKIIFRLQKEHLIKI
jgi:5-(carboxyamino)imidazole ribonucleotide synthase